MRTTRRELLRAGVSAAAVASGCLSGSAPSPTPRIGSVLALNFHGEPVILRLAVEREDGPIVYEETVDLPARESGDPGEAVVETFPGEPPEGTLRAWTGERWSPGDGRYDHASRETCTDAIVEVGDPGDSDSDAVSIFTGNCR